MSVALITERIRSSIAAGELQVQPDSVPLEDLRILDLLKPWSEIFPGVQLDAIGQRDLFGYRGILHQPKFRSQVRMSSRPLQVPEYYPAPNKTIDPGLFTSIQAIHTWYEQQGISATDLINAAFDGKELDKFIDPLFLKIQDYWPLPVPLENIYIPDDFSALGALSLMIPHWPYEEEYAGVVEAFLTGANGIEWLMRHYYGLEGFLTLPDEDIALIEKVGFGELSVCYEKEESASRSMNLQKLENFQETFFGKIWEKYPERADEDLPIISGNGGYDAEIPICKAADIDFCIDYAEAFFTLHDHMLDPASIEENEQGITNDFAHELCEVYRAENNLPPVSWTSPKELEVRT